MLASQRPVYLFGNLLVMLITGAALWSAAPPTLILIWCISGALLTLLRVLDWRKFQRQRPEQPAQISNWLQQFMFFTAVGGIIWGVGGFWFIDPVEPQRMIFLITVFLGIGTASIPALCLHFAGFAAFVIPMFLPLILKLTLSGQPFLAVLASLLFCYLIVILFFGRNLNAAITTSITLELENALLLEQVTVAKEQAELANVEKSRFLASVSHDVRQPLYAMGLFLGSLERNDLSVRNGELIRDIENAYSALEDMCQALLEISRLDAGAVEPNVVSISLSELVQRLVPDAQRGSDDKALEFHYQLEQSICVRSDPILLERILRNLLSNAVKYTDSGFVSIEAEKVEQNMVVTISDSGHGISSDDYEKVFDEYQQLENPERDRTKGLGLGLSVVRRMCDLLQHSIRVDSVIGKGSKFSVTVPLGDPNSIVQPTIEEYQNDIT
ncbi:MAG: signal transduction histidine kinase, partial [Kiritimatiellia bacterium]